MRLGKTIDQPLHDRTERVGLHVHLAEDSGDDSVRLREKREQDVFRDDFRIPGALGQLLRGQNGLLSLFGIAVEVHVPSSFNCSYNFLCSADKDAGIWTSTVA